MADNKNAAHSWEAFDYLQKLVASIRCPPLDSKASFASSARAVLGTGFPFLCRRHIGMHLDDHEIPDRNFGKWSKIASSLLRTNPF
ncbi:MAG: hypothetical protein HW412_171 [Bacteroidetes bacterium]|nr:hypothetical protein [Bacteroidota bacterium]